MDNTFVTVVYLRKNKHPRPRTRLRNNKLYISQLRRYGLQFFEHNLDIDKLYQMAFIITGKATEKDIDKIRKLKYVHRIMYWTDFENDIRTIAKDNM